MALLTLDDMEMRFGGLTAINDLSFAVERGEIRGLIGPNGAGKTTLFNVISGVYRPSKGKVMFKNKDITRLKPHRVVELGLARTFQGVTLFKNFSVLKNVLAGCHLHSDYNYWGALFGTRRTLRNEARNQARAMEILEFVGLEQHSEELAVNLPHGHQRALGIAIALASQPEFLMLDEPCAGMNIEETDEMVRLISKIHDSGTTLLLIEHDMKVVMGLCHKITVINFGTKIAEGTPDEILKNEVVHEAYLGSDIDAA